MQKRVFKEKTTATNTNQTKARIIALVLIGAMLLSLFVPSNVVPQTRAAGGQDTTFTGEEINTILKKLPMEYYQTRTSSSVLDARPLVGEPAPEAEEDEDVFLLLSENDGSEEAEPEPEDTAFVEEPAEEEPETEAFEDFATEEVLAEEVPEEVPQEAEEFLQEESPSKEESSSPQEPETLPEPEEEEPPAVYEEEPEELEEAPEEEEPEETVSYPIEENETEKNENEEVPAIMPLPEETEEAEEETETSPEEESTKEEEQAELYADYHTEDYHIETIQCSSVAPSVFNKAVSLSYEGKLLAWYVPGDEGGFEQKNTVYLYYDKAGQNDRPYANRNLSHAFQNFKRLTSVDGLSLLDTSDLSEAAELFTGDECLRDITGLSGWKTDSLKNLTSSFAGCTCLEEVRDVLNPHSFLLAGEEYTAWNLSTLSCPFAFSGTRVTEYPDWYYQSQGMEIPEALQKEANRQEKGEETAGPAEEVSTQEGMSSAETTEPVSTQEEVSSAEPAEPVSTQEEPTNPVSTQEKDTEQKEKSSEEEEKELSPTEPETEVPEEILPEELSSLMEEEPEQEESSEAEDAGSFGFSVSDNFLPRKTETEDKSEEEFSEIIEEESEEEISQIAEQESEEELSKIAETRSEEELSQIAEQEPEEGLSQIAKENSEEELSKIAETRSEKGLSQIAEENSEEDLSKIAEQESEEELSQIAEQESEEDLSKIAETRSEKGDNIDQTTGEVEEASEQAEEMFLFEEEESSMQEHREDLFVVVPVEEESASEKESEETEPESEEEEPYEKTFTYEDSFVEITATVRDREILPEHASFFCEPIGEKTPEYEQLRQKMSELYGLTQEMIDIFPYDISFRVGAEECEPKAGGVALRFTLKDPISVKEEESFEVVHFRNGEQAEILSSSKTNTEQVDCVEVELGSFSPVVLAVTNVQGTMLKSVQKTGEGGAVYYISKTPNINDNGVGTGYYANSQNLTDTVSVDGALALDVEVRYGGERINYDYLYIKNAQDVIYYEDDEGNTVGSTNSSYRGRIGGSTNFETSATNTYSGPQNTLYYHFDTDTLKFVWHTDGSGVGYGYYAIITPVLPTGPIPDYHIEEKEDGSYALIFDKGGEINAFLSRAEVQEQLAPYLNNISEIRLHKDTTAITTGSFKNMPALTTVTMPRNSQLHTVGKNAFAGCDSLESFHFPATVTEIDSTCFSGCTSMQSVTFDAGNTMTELPDGMFQGMTALTQVTLPTGLTKIPDSCFDGCTNLADVAVPASVTEIGSAAFRNTKIMEVPPLDNITTIGANAFYGCTGLTEVSIPAGVTSIGTGAFQNCSNVTDFVFEEGTSFPTLPTYLFSGMSKLEHVELPSDLTRIPNYCFNGCSRLQSVAIPDTVTRIGDYAFQNCSRLVDFEIPSQITTLGPYVFYGCTSLKDMTIPATVTSIGTGLFYGCSNLIRAEFAAGSPVSTLPGSMFYGCSKLEYVKLPDNVTAIPASYFRDCTSLTHVDLPDNLTSIGDYAFYNCYNLEDLTLNQGLKTIGASAFYNCDRITEVFIPKSVTSIGANAWQNCDGITSVVWEEGSPMTTLNTYLFYGCSKLENLVLPTNLSYVPDYLCGNCVKLANVDLPDRITRIGSYAFDGCTALTEIEIPTSCTQIYSYAFRNSGLREIELSPNTTSIGNYAFQNSKLTQIVIPNKVTSIGTYAFDGVSTLESVVFTPGGSNCSIGNYAFRNCYALRELQLKEGNTTIGTYAFQEDRVLTDVTIPSTVTQVSNYAFNNAKGMRTLSFPYGSSNLSIGSSTTGYAFARLANIEEVFIDRNITSSYNTQTNFAEIAPDAKFIIGEHVDTLDNMFVSVFTDKTKVEFRGENDFSVSTRIANLSQDVKWSELVGDFYVDSEGVVYKLNKTNGTASLFYIPEGISSYTVPATVTSVAGREYLVNYVDSYVGKNATDLTALTFESPETVTIPQFAFSRCPSLLTINGEPELYREDWESVSSLCDFPIHSDYVSQQVLSINDSIAVGEGGADAPRFSFGVAISNQERMDTDELTYIYPTGRSARLDFAISNESNIDMSDRVIRIYFAFDGDNYTMGNYSPGNNYTLVNTATGARYPFKVRATDAKGIYYYDITGFRPGDTLAFNNQFMYSSPTSGGGTMKVWVESISQAEADEKEGKTSEPGNYILAEWYSTPVPYNLAKQVNGNPQFEFTANATDENDDDIYIRNMQYQVSLTSSGASGSNYAKDYITYVDFYDDLQLTEGLEWNPDIIAAIKNNEFYVNSSNYIYVRINGEWVELCHMSFNSTSLVRSIYPEVVEEDGEEAVRIHWSYRNTYWSDTKTAPTADIPATQYYLYFGNRSIQVKEGSRLWQMFREGVEIPAEESEALRRIANKVTETSHYSFSEDQTNVAQTPMRPIYMSTGFSMSKSYTGYTSFGREHGFIISVTNSGLVHKTDVDFIEDSLREHYYIKPEDMLAMFQNPSWGPFLRIDISSATLCSLPNKTVKDVYGNEFSITEARISGIDPIPYSGCAPAGSDLSEQVTDAKLALYWDPTYSHLILDVANNAGTVLSSYAIGSGCDYETIQDAFDALGYLVTYRAAYKVSWDLDEPYTHYKAMADGLTQAEYEALTSEEKAVYEYKLRSGRTERFEILSTVKDTTMWLTKDEPTQYPSSSVSSSNTAYARDSGGRQVGVANWSGTVYRELSLGKSAYANGQSYTSNMQVPDDTVVDYTLSFTNSGGTFETLPLTDKMGGAQILLIPTRGNQNALYYAAGSSTGIPLSEAGLEIKTESGIPYYILDQAGTYKGVTIDGRQADTITVSTQPGQAITQITWYYRNVTGASTNASSVSRSVSYKALVDSSRLGGRVEDTNGSTVTASGLQNEAWLGGHQTHRLYASLAGASERLQFIKWIVSDPEAQREQLIRHSLVQDGDEVLYKIIISNSGNSPATINGRSIHDELPSTSGIFPWSKANVTDVYYVTEDLGSIVTTTGPEYWYVNSIQPNSGADTASRGLYYIYWTEDFEIQLEPKGEVWIYVKLQFPSSEDIDDITGQPSNTWDDYIAQNNGGNITNYFYIGQRQSNVTHELADVVEGTLVKGVLDTGLSRSGYFQSENTRHFYQNGGNTDNGSVQEVVYYTVIYNSGNVRLYLDPLRDQLPKGFKFRGLANVIPNNAFTNSGFNTTSSGSNYNTIGGYNSFTTLRNTEYSSSSYQPVATVTDGEKTITYKSAYISASTADDGDGHQQVTFNIGSQSYGNLLYDSDLQKYYLAPGQAIRFAYMCTVEGHARTENMATNEIAMPVYDKYGLGVFESGEEVVVTPALFRDLARNDGECDLATTEEEAGGHLHARSAWVKGTTEWFSSQVSLQRLSSVPGIAKSVGGETYIASNVVISRDNIYGSLYTDSAKGGTAYVGTVARTSIVNWNIRIYNEGGTGANSMEDFWIEDTVDAPYMFTGNYFYDYYNMDGTKMTSSSVPLFSLGGRGENDTTVKISTGASASLTLDSIITINGPAVSVDGGRAEVQLLRDDVTGVETLRIHIIDAMHRIPPNCYMSLYEHTQYVSNDAVLSKQFYNHAQLEPSGDFDPALVSQGKVLYREDDGDQIPYAIESGASVTMTAGYTTAARKQVTEMGLTSNTGWSDRTKNYIMLPEKFSQFYYDLYVDLPKDDPTQKLVLIDALPEPGDHSPFVSRDYRDSEFTVSFLESNPGFAVWSSPNLGAGTKVPLGYSDWTLEVSPKTEFDTTDWEGNGSGWTSIDLSDGISAAEETALTLARSFRIIMEDPDLLTDPANAMMGKNYQVQVRFHAKLKTPAEADPGAIAWNSFGYRYTVPIGATGMSTSLNAEPLKVGVMIPAVPYVIKDQKTPHGHYKPIDTATTYRFLIYSGSALADLNDISEMTMGDIADILSANSRDVLLTQITVDPAASSGQTDFLDEEKVWVYNSSLGDYEPSAQNWIWANAARYTIIELPWSENGFQFDNILHNPVNNYTFTQNTGNNVVLRVTNVYKEKGRLKVQKTVQGPSYDPEKRFTFTIHMQDGRYPVYGNFNYIGTNMRDGSLTFNDAGDAAIQLKHGQAIEILDIPEGYTYTVTEAEDVLYTKASTGESGSIIADSLQTAAFTNTRKDTSLIITKTVTGNMGNKYQLFDFEIYITDEGRELSGEFPLVIAHNDETTSSQTLTFTEGAVVIQLRHGDTATVSGLPVGARYEVDELAASRKGYAYESTNETGSLTETPKQSDWTNNKSLAVPTDLFDRDAFRMLLAALAVLAGGAVYLFVSKRKSKQ